LSENAFVDDVVRPFVVAAFAVPFIALAPLLVAWLGVGFLPATVVACVSSFFMIFFSAYSGVRETSPALLNIAKLMGANGIQRALKIKLPSALPFIVEGLYAGLIYAFHGEVVGEMLASNSGLGYVIAYAASQMDAGGVIAGLVVLGTLAYGLILSLDATYRRFIPMASAPRAAAGLQ
jgi:NitT/TauT family transport system permease protein